MQDMLTDTAGTIWPAAALTLAACGWGLWVYELAPRRRGKKLDKAIAEQRKQQRGEK